MVTWTKKKLIPIIHQAHFTFHYWIVNCVLGRKCLIVVPIPNKGSISGQFRCWNFRPVQKGTQKNGMDNGWRAMASMDSFFVDWFKENLKKLLNFHHVNAKHTECIIIFSISHAQHIAATMTTTKTTTIKWINLNNNLIIHWRWQLMNKCYSTMCLFTIRTAP